jgi:hypothetical protein
LIPEQLAINRSRRECDNSFHEKADPCQEFFLLFPQFLVFFPFSQAASVATLPSALLVERFSLGASWVFSIH